MSYQIPPPPFPQPTRYEPDGSPTWVLDGGTFTNRGWIVPLERLAEFVIPAPPPPPASDVPQVLTRRQLLRALSFLESRTRDELDQLIRGIIDQAPASALEKDRLLSSWLDSGSINQADPDTQLLLQYVAQAWGMDQERIDAVFRLGATFP